MTRFPTYPPDILSRADALLSEKYPDGIVDPRFVEIACEAMMMERERCAKIAEEYDGDGMSSIHSAAQLGDAYETRDDIAKAIKGASPSPGTTE